MTTQAISNTIDKSLGRTSGRLLATLAERGQVLFTTADATEILDGDPQTVAKLLHDLVQRKWLKRLEKGKYMLLPLASGLEGHYTYHEFVIAASLLSPYYISYWTALNYYGFTEQVSRTIFVATTARKQEVSFSGLTYKFVTLVPRKFFGFTQEWIEDQGVNVATPEKTIVDCLDHPEYAGGIVEAAKGMWYGTEEGRLDFDMLTRYAERMGNRTIFKRLGHLAEVLELPIGERYIEAWRGKISAGYGILDPLAPREGDYDSRWKLRVNLGKGELSDWRAH